MQSRKLILEILKIVVQSPETHSSCDDCGIIVYHLISNKLISFDMVLDTLREKVIPCVTDLTNPYLKTVRFLARFLYIILFHENEIISEDCRLERLDWVWILEPPRRLHEPSKREEFSNAWEEVICEFLEFLRGDRRLPSVIRGAAKAAKESSSRTNLEEIMDLLELEQPGIEQRGYIRMKAMAYSYSEIKAASKILRKIVHQQPNIHRTAFSRPFYLNLNPEASSHRFRNANELSCREIVKINVYYMSRLLTKFEDFVVRSVQFGLLTLDDKEAVMQLATPLERTVAMICKIITKDGKMFPILIEILKMTDNQEIVQMLENNLQNEAASSEVEIDRPHLKNEEGVQEKTSEACGAISKKWNCRYCTFLNEGDGISCSMCYRSQKVFDDEESVYFCPRCTLESKPGSLQCALCEADLRSVESDDEDLNEFFDAD